MLGDGLFYGVLYIGPLAFDNGQGDSVHEEDDIRTIMLFASGFHHGKFFRYMEDVSLGIFPVYVLQVEAFLVPVNALFQGFPERQEIVRVLRGADVPLVKRNALQGQNPRLDIRIAERIRLAGTGMDGIDFPELFPEHVVQDDVRRFASPERERFERGQIGVSQFLEHLKRRNLR